jgi:hypothetical protein
MQATPASNETRLPRAVLRRSAAIAERIQARESEAAPAAEPTPPATPSAEAAPSADPTPSAPAAPPVDPRESDPAYWKQRFKVTEGVLRAERTEREAEAQRFNQQLTELQDQIRTLQASAPEGEIDMGQFLTPEQIDTLGEEEARAVVKAAMNVAQSEVRKVVEAELKPLRDQRQADEASASRNAKVAFVEALTEILPNFGEIDASDGWKLWLTQDDPETGIQRQAILDAHVKKGDAKKVAGMFQKYEKEHALPQPPVAPSGSGAVPSGDILAANAAGLRPLTAAEIRDFFKRASLGKVTDAERVTFEARRKLPRR